MYTIVLKLEKEDTAGRQCCFMDVCGLYNTLEDAATIVQHGDWGKIFSEIFKENYTFGTVLSMGMQPCYLETDM